jgi:NADPH-dependent 2,4-dienoyl-CoA reductase/sulfur reductase-like enzyme/rhodanese-related sulfurtransferase
MSDNKVKDPRQKQRIIIVGGIAGGASCAARARRLSETAEIVVYEKGQNVSFASCGLPYYVGNIITEERNLLVATPELFRQRFNIDIRLKTEVLRIERDKRLIITRNLETSEENFDEYDALVLSPGALPVKPPIKGISGPGIFVLRTIQDSRNIKIWIAQKNVKKAAIIGGGFIGLETAENLANLGIDITIIERLPQIMTNLDPEIALKLQERLEEHKVHCLLNQSVTEFESNSHGIRVSCADTPRLFDMVILAMGVKPEITLALQAGLSIGNRGGIQVDDQMRTNDSRIWAVGDAVEVKNFISGEWGLLPLAGPANRQGRIAADVMFGRSSRFHGVQGTMVCQAFGLTAAATGLSENTLSALNGKIPYEKVYIYPTQHANYYPGAKTISMKIIFSPQNGKILGAQAVGEEGVEKRIDVISMAIQKNGSVEDLEEAEMCYAPQFGSAKDAVNMAGMVASNVLRGDSPVTHWEKLERGNHFDLDVRQPSEFAVSHYENATNIPLPDLRARLGEIPRDRTVAVCCAGGQRSYYATRILRLNGFDAINISGGMTAYKNITRK